jgi:hypothetical protein
LVTAIATKATESVHDGISSPPGQGLFR